MAKLNLEGKKANVSEVRDLIKNSKAIVFLDYKGLNVARDTEMRKAFRSSSVVYKVLKNNIVYRAFEEMGFKGSSDFLKGPTAVAFSNKDEVSAAKIARESGEKYKQTQIKGGFVDGKMLSADEVNTLSFIPSREVLIARLLGMLTAPARSLAVVLDQIAKQKA